MARLEYELNTIICGTTSASFLAIRTLHKLARDDGHLHPKAAKVPLNDFYVDAVMSAASTSSEVTKTAKPLIQLTGRDVFPFRKWGPSNQDVSTRTRLSKYRESNGELRPMSMNFISILPQK